MWLAENEGGIWLATESSLLKKMHLWIQPRQESLKNSHVNTDQFTHKCKQVHKWKASCKFKFNSFYINVTTSNYILMTIANIFLIHIFMDLYYIYLKQGTFVWIRNVFVKLIFVYGFILHLYITISNCVCIEIFLWEESNLYINHKIHLWILLCAFIINETVLIWPHM